MEPALTASLFLIYFHGQKTFLVNGQVISNFSFDSLVVSVAATYSAVAQEQLRAMCKQTGMAMF